MCCFGLPSDGGLCVDRHENRFHPALFLLASPGAETGRLRQPDPEVAAGLPWRRALAGRWRRPPIVPGIWALQARPFKSQAVQGEYRMRASLDGAPAANPLQLVEADHVSGFSENR